MKKFLCMILAVLTAACAMGMAACGGNGNTLIVYTEAGFAPFEYIKDSKIVGADVDIMNLVGEELGMSVQFENVAFDQIVDTVSAGKLAKVGAAGISITEERKEKVAFSVPYYTANLFVIYQVTAEGGVLDGKNVTKTGYDALSTAVADIGLNIDVVIIDELPAKQLIKDNSKLKCAPLYYQGADGEADEAAVDEYAICVTKGETEILNAINKVLNALLAETDENGNNGVEQLVMEHLGV